MDTAATDALDQIAGDIVPETLGTVELTPREIAIAKGEDPDTISTPVSDEQAEDTAAAEVAEDTDVDGDPVVETPETADEPTAPWYSADDLEYARQYGLQAYDLATFSDRADLLKTTRFLDRYSATQKPATPSPVKVEEEAAKADGPFNADGTVNREWFAKGEYDEGVIALAEALNKTQATTAEMKRQNEWLTQNLAEQQERQVNEVFHDSVDALGRPDFYGQSLVNGKPQLVSDKELGRRNALRQEIDVLASVYQAKGIAPPTFADLVRRAEANVFQHELAAIDAKKAAATSQADRQAKVNKIAEQSKRRRNVASTTANAQRSAPHADPHSTQAITENPAVVALFRRFEEETGTRI